MKFGMDGKSQRGNAMLDVKMIERGLKKTGKSKGGLAAAMGVRPGAVSEIFSGIRLIKASEIEPIMEYLRRMGHAPFQYPTPDGYPLEEQPWLGTLLWRWNFSLALQAGHLKGTSVDAAKLAEKIEPRVVRATRIMELAM